MSLLSTLSTLSITDYLILFVIGLTTYVLIFYYRYFTRENPLPGPTPLPILGNVLQYPGDAGKWIEQLRLIYGDMFEIYLGSKRAVCLCKSNLIGNLINSPLRTSANDGLDELGVSHKGVLLNRNHDDWSYHRRFLHKTIGSPSCVKEAVISAQVSFQEMDKLWKLSYYDKEIDFFEWITRFTFENVVSLTTTLKVHAIKNYYNSMNPQNKVIEPEGALPNSEAYIKSLKTLFESIHFFLLTPKILRHSPGIKKTTKSFLDNGAWLCENLLKIIKERRYQIENLKENNNNDLSLLTQLLTINTDNDITKNISDNKHPERMSDDDVRANIMDPILGGTLTTANTISYIVYYLAHHPKVQERMVQELDNILGNDRDSKVTLEQINKLEYTEAVIKEVSRLFPTIPVNLRSNSKPIEISGYTFPSDTQFFIDIEGIHNSSEWTEPDTFNPDRWLKTSDIENPKNSFLPFGNGTRICPGKNLALIEIRTLIALLYRKYDVELVDKVSPLKYHYSFIKLCDELKVKIRPRS